MTETFDGNGDYSYNDEDIDQFNSDFKRKGSGDNHENKEQQNEEGSTLNEKANEYLRDCLLEKSKLEKKFPIAERLLESEIEKVQTTGRIPTRDPKYVDVYREKPIKVSQKVRVPVREHPKFNFVGKLLGPKGNSLRRLQEETLCKMTVLGRNSMKDRAKEEELRASMDPKYAHLNEDLHVEVSTIAPPAEAHARIAYAMAELRKYLIPDSNDVIRQEQLRELMDQPENEGKPLPYKKPGPSIPPKPSYGYRVNAVLNLKKIKHIIDRPPQQVAASHPSSGPPSRIAMPPKQKVLSILDKARTAMDESYSRHYEEPIPYEPPTYDSYSYSHPPTVSSRIPYEPPEYEPTEYRREYYQHSPNYHPPVKSSSSSVHHPSWKQTSNSAGGNYHSTSSSRRHDDLPPPPSMSSSGSKHLHSSREARYKNVPYSRPK